MQSNLITIKNVDYKIANQFVLKDISFDIKQHDYIGLFGPNGAGKTTLIKLLLGLINPTSGKVIRKGGLKTGYVPQSLNEDGYFPGSVSELLNNSGSRNVNKFFGIDSIKNKLFNSLSGGQKQKVVISLCLSNNPDLIILDEPTNALDSKTQNKLFEYLKEINSKGTAIIIISHDIDMVVKEAKQILCLNVELTKDCPSVDFKVTDLNSIYGKDYKIIKHTHSLS